MVFSSVTFLFFFLPAILAANAVAPARLKNAVLLVASIAVNYLLGHVVERRALAGDRRGALVPLAVAVLLNVGLLAWFKYANFTVAQLNGILGAAGAGSIPWADVILPIGISFYTFHSLSYLVDLYRGAASHLSSPIDFALYITFFPQLVAGPIVRFHEIRDQIVARTESRAEFTLGAIRFCHGLAKKVLIADTVAPVANAAFAVPPGELNAATALLGVAAYTVQLYFDFSGYSDMALGLGRMFGFHLPENFDRPYASQSITEFWRRWHMSLSRWFRDYLYIPLGGNRGSAASTYRNLILVFLATGIWHGANWTFLAWGAYHGVLLLIERRLGVGRSAAVAAGTGAAVTGAPDRADATPRHSWPARLRTIGLVALGWILFRSPDIGWALGYMAALVRPGLELVGSVAVPFATLPRLALAIGLASFLLPAGWVTGRRLTEDPRPVLSGARLAVVLVVLPIAIVVLLAGDFSPFLYFNF